MTTKPVHTGILEAILRSEERNEYSPEARERKEKPLRLRIRLRAHTE